MGGLGSARPAQPSPPPPAQSPAPAPAPAAPSPRAPAPGQPQGPSPRAPAPAPAPAPEPRKSCRLADGRPTYTTCDGLKNMGPKEKFFSGRPLCKRTRLADPSRVGWPTVGQPTRLATDLKTWVQKRNSSAVGLCKRTRLADPSKLTRTQTLNNFY